MATWIKAGFWQQLCKPCIGYKGWLNLDQLIESIAGPGVPGPQGPQGVPGEQGQNGEQGIPGQQGEQGLKGDTGDQGPAGNSVTILGSYVDLAAFLAGAGSLPGDNIGDAWILLSDGSLYSWNGSVWFDAGDIKGPQGDKGDKGEQGVPGIQGVPGNQGNQGNQGLQGNAATIAAGTTSTGAPGTNASVTNVGTSSAAVFNFTIPRGDVGATGATGSQGPAGLPGLFAQTADSTPVVNTAVETTIVGPGVGSLTVPANGFSIGDSFTCALDGILSCGSSATLHIRIKTLTGVLLADTGIIDMAAATNKAWVMNLYFTIRTLGGATVASISSGGLFSYIRNGGTQFEGYVLSTVNNTTFDTTVNNTLVITAQWDPGSTGNSITSKNFTLTKIY